MWTCKPQNGVPGGGDISGGKLDRFLCVPGSRVRVAPEGNIAQGGGYVSRNRLVVCFHGSFCYLAAGAVTWQCGRPDSAGRTSRNERDGSDPPFYAAGAARKGVGLFQAMLHVS